MKIVMKLWTCAVVLLLFTGCHDDLDDSFSPAGDLDIKNFIWKGMNNMYLYKPEVPDLADTRFENQEELDAFLSTFASPEDLFYDGLVAAPDDFSFLVDDYLELEKSLDGIRVSNGMQFGLIRYTTNSQEVLGYVRYVLPNTSASEKGIKRGDLFNTVDGQQLTVDNYSRLLEPTSYTIGLAEINDDVISSTGESVTLQKEEYTTNPVFLARTIDVAGKSIGYLMYNAFTSTFDEELNNSFVSFKAAGVDELILDLRYNSGGSVETANDLASMITGQFTGEIFYSEQWNPDYQAFFEQSDPESLVNRFNEKISSGASINKLGLSKVYALTTLRTASASELLINGLKPYITVIQIGERTTGKFQASTTLYDSPNFRRKGANPGHIYAIQPLIYKTINADGVTDYLNGLQPDIELEEDIRNLGTIGDLNEPLLQAALNAIQGEPQQTKSRDLVKHKLIYESGMNELLYQRMYSDEVFPVMH